MGPMRQNPIQATVRTAHLRHTSELKPEDVINLFKSSTHSAEPLRQAVKLVQVPRRGYMVNNPCGAVAAGRLANAG